MDGLFIERTSTVSLYIDVRITMILSVDYLSRIFKMFQGLMNNPVFLRIQIQLQCHVTVKLMT